MGLRGNNDAPIVFTAGVWLHRHTFTDLRGNTDAPPRTYFLLIEDRGLWGSRSAPFGGLGTLLFAVGVWGGGLVLGLHDGHVVRQRAAGADLAAGIPRQHDLHLDAQHTCTKSTGNISQWSGSVCRLSDSRSKDQRFESRPIQEYKKNL